MGHPKYKLASLDNILYTDTDSIDIDKPLDPKYVGEELGQLKLEHIFDEAVYLAPKMYGGVTKDYGYIKIKGVKSKIKIISVKFLLAFYFISFSIY